MPMKSAERGVAEPVTHPENCSSWEEGIHVAVTWHGGTRTPKDASRRWGVGGVGGTTVLQRAAGGARQRSHLVPFQLRQGSERHFQEDCQEKSVWHLQSPGTKN